VPWREILLEFIQIKVMRSRDENILGIWVYCDLKKGTKWKNEPSVVKDSNKKKRRENGRNEFEHC
jgi:hypothetical protein